MIQDWDDPVKIQKYFQLGVKESGAISNLKVRVSKKTLEELWAAVRIRGMRWITHEALQKDLFNVGYTSGAGGWEAWKAECCNKMDDELVPRFITHVFLPLYYQTGIANIYLVFRSGHDLRLNSSLSA